MYGLRQAALLAYNNLCNILAPHGYYPVMGMVGLWKHKTRNIKFCLCVDDFGIKYFSKTDINHLINAIAEHYKYTVDWEGSNYCGLTFDWHYKDGYVDVSMGNYIHDSLKRLNHNPTKQPQYSPHKHVPIKYGTKGTQ